MYKIVHATFIKFYSESVHRYYENRRRRLLDKQPARLSIVKETKKTAQTKSYRKQVQKVTVGEIVITKLCVHAHVHACVHVCVRECVHMCVCARVCACACVCT